MAAVTEIVSQPAAERAKHLRDIDSLARLLGPADRAAADLTRKERAVVQRIANAQDLSRLAARAMLLLAASSDDRGQGLPPPD